MSTNAVESLSNAIDTVNAFQDRLVANYLQPYSVTFVYWAFAFVFLYIGLEKVVPHRSSADVQLATIGGVLGVPYVPFVTFIGAYQMAIGGAFLLRRLRVAGLLFFSYQFFAFGTLVVLRHIVFQPPWISVLGFEVPWALGAYSAFILKNLVLAGVFFVLVSQEFGGDATPGGARP